MSVLEPVEEKSCCICMDGRPEKTCCKGRKGNNMCSPCFWMKELSKRNNGHEHCYICRSPLPKEEPRVTERNQRREETQRLLTEKQIATIKAAIIEGETQIDMGGQKLTKATQQYLKDCDYVHEVCGLYEYDPGRAEEGENKEKDLADGIVCLILLAMIAIIIGGICSALKCGA